MISKGELKDLVFAVYLVLYSMIWCKVIVQRFAFGMFDFGVIVIGNYLLLHRCLMVRRINRMCDVFKSLNNRP